MTKSLLLLALCASGLVAADVSGEWYLTIIAQGERIAAGKIDVHQTERQISFKFSGMELKGDLDGNKVSLSGTNEGRTVTMKGAISGNRMEGDAVIPSGLTGKWSADRVTPLARGSKVHDFTPTQFQRYLSASISPVLRIQPGDTVRTWSVDAGGRDATGKTLSLGGNPLTGPFYIEGANPGDVVSIKLVKVRLNRDSAGSGKGLMWNAISPGYVRDLKEDKNVEPRWTLADGMATLTKPTPALKNFRVPTKPMLGCVGVAPRGGDAISTRDSGDHGGNMDYNQIQEGTTVYLPVFHPGALLFVGDGHAAQGDGELTGDALETSMDIEFQVDVLPDTGKSIGMPYAENDEYLMMIGIGGSLDQALQRSTTAMGRWLEREYKLNSNEAALVLGFALKYDIADLVGTQVAITAKLPKSTLAQLKQ
jgi:amidase